MGKDTSKSARTFSVGSKRFGEGPFGVGAFSAASASAPAAASRRLLRALRPSVALWPSVGSLAGARFRCRSRRLLRTQHASNGQRAAEAAAAPAASCGYCA